MTFQPDHRTEYDHDAGTVTVSLTMTTEQFRVVSSYANAHVSLWDFGADGAITLNEIHDDEHIETVTVKPDGTVIEAVLERAYGGYRYYSYDENDDRIEVEVKDTDDGFVITGVLGIVGDTL